MLLSEDLISSRMQKYSIHMGIEMKLPTLLAGKEMMLAPVGHAHRNPILDSRIFTIHFVNGEEKDVAFNVLAEHLYSQDDSEGNQHQIFKEIFNHRRNKTALDKADQYHIVSNGRRTLKKSVAG
jgi:hypothetical protein